MAESDSGEKTEEATQQRRDDFRKRGQVAQTKELGTVFLLFSTIFAIWALGHFFLMNLFEIFDKSLTTYFIDAARSGDLKPALMFVVEKTVFLVAPVFGLFWITSFASSVIQVGFLINEEALQFKIEKLNPVEGFKRIFSMKSVVEGLKAVVKVTAVLAVVLIIMKDEVDAIPTLVQFSMTQIIEFIGDITVKLLTGVGFFMITIAGLDFAFQKFDLEKKMKMSKQEVKEEHKSREGDPLIKSRIRKVQREIANRRMMEEIPKADVIITNPTHIAVALKYDATVVAPKIVAMGAGVIAERIKALAKENSVPVVENKPLARVIFKTLKIGQVIPKELYTAIAEVLSYVYKLKRKKVRA